MWLPVASDSDAAVGKKARYPIRPSEPDCVFYLKTGCCKFGSYCRFNHPWDRSRKSTEEFQTIKELDKEFSKTFDHCKYNLMPGGCRLGEACKYSHSHDTAESIPVELNALGLPVRKGERLCFYYMRNGICKYNSNCKFHHPEPSQVTQLQAFGCQNSNFLQATTWAMHLPLRSQALMTVSDDSGSNFDALRTQRSVVSSEWLDQCEDQIRRKDLDESQSQNRTKCEGFNVALACLPNHLKGHLSESATCLLSSIGLPQRPDQPVCIYYSRYGICKYGPGCKFDHPVVESLEQSLNVLKLG